LQTSTVAGNTHRSGTAAIAGPKPVLKPLTIKPGLGLLSAIALFSLSLEAEVLQQIDSLRLYLAWREIALEVGFALLVTLAIASTWWFVAGALGRVARSGLRSEHLRIKLQWVLWITVPLVYLALELFRDFNLEVLPNWHPTPNHEVLGGLVLLGICIFGFFGISSLTIQSFCRTRLVPIAWAHILLAVIAVLALWVHGVRLFRNYQHPAQGIVASRLPDVYLITIDALRAEDTSAYGYYRQTTPNLEKFARRSFTFDNFFANANFTNPATSTIETGKLPWTDRVFQQGGFLRDENQEQNLAAALKQRGYYTASVVSNFLASPFHHRTLESYDAVQYTAPLGLNGLRLRGLNLIGLNTQATLSLSLIRGVNSLASYLDRVLWPERYPLPAEAVFSRATELMERNGNSHPTFIWSHIYPPHDPYWVPPAYRNRFAPSTITSYKYMVPEREKQGPGVSVEQLRASYDEMIAYSDHCLGEFLDWLDRTGRLDGAIVIVSADHGEFFDHNRLSHGSPDLYNGVVHVPLLIHLPGQKQGERIEQVAQQADLLPTILDLISAPPPSWGDGTSLRPALEHSVIQKRYIFTMNLETNRIFDPITKGTVAVIDDDFKFVRYLDSGKELLFRYKTDAAEEHNLLATEPEVAKRMRDVLLNKIQEVNQKPINLQ
jgi:arylsulfatase A-like enzyme